MRPGFKALFATVCLVPVDYAAREAARLAKLEAMGFHKALH